MKSAFFKREVTVVKLLHFFGNETRWSQHETQMRRRNLLFLVDVTPQLNEANVNLKKGKNLILSMYVNMECIRIKFRVWGSAYHPTIVSSTATVDTGTNPNNKMDNSDTDVCGYFNI